MTTRHRNPVGTAEYYLRHMERLPKITAAERRFFWEQRSWHPVVKMKWVDETKSDGTGTTLYPDGTTRIYELSHQSQLDKRA
jgi:hypothetical protein